MQRRRRDEVLHAWLIQDEVLQSEEFIAPHPCTPPYRYDISKLHAVPLPIRRLHWMNYGTKGALSNKLQPVILRHVL